MRFWISGPRLLNGMVRPGVSFGREDFSPRLPSWRKFEVCHGLIKAAEARGEKITKDEATYLVDKALAAGTLDSTGGLRFKASGNNAKEIAKHIVKFSTSWGQPVSNDDALSMARAGIRRIWYENIMKAVLLFIAAMSGVALGAFWKGAFL